MATGGGGIYVQKQLSGDSCGPPLTPGWDTKHIYVNLAE
jgi:hypothetical protein